MNRNRILMSKRSALFAVLLIVCLSAAVVVLVNSRDKDDNNKTSHEQKLTVPTRTQETEGQKIKVPESVDPGSIKNYELITENDQFKIRKLNGEYTITLYAIINRPSDSESYHQQLRDYKAAALKYLEDSGVNTNKVKVIYDPPEATNL